VPRSNVGRRLEGDSGLEGFGGVKQQPLVEGPRQQLHAQGNLQKKEGGGGQLAF